VKNILEEKGQYSEKLDPLVDPEVFNTDVVGCYLIGINHDLFRTLKFKTGSVVIDPFGIIGRQTGVKIIKIGRRA
jgi:hypothetical protein